MSTWAPARAAALASLHPSVSINPNSTIRRLAAASIANQTCVLADVPEGGIAHDVGQLLDKMVRAPSFHLTTLSPRCMHALTLFLSSGSHCHHGKDSARYTSVPQSSDGAYARLFIHTASLPCCMGLPSAAQLPSVIYQSVSGVSRLTQSPWLCLALGV